jgi:hypothetical protein
MKMSIARSARIAAAASVIMTGVFVAQPMTSTAASPLAAVISCHTALSFPGSGSSTCNGTASGIADGKAAVSQAFDSSFTYHEPCPPTTGTANGTYSSGTASGSFSWTRVGLTAIVVLHPTGGSAGAAAALFIPGGLQAGSLTAPCPPSNVNATVVAIGAGA